MSDKILVGTVPGGRRFFSVERDGRKMPVLNGEGEVEFWGARGQGGIDRAEAMFIRTLRALEQPEKLRDVTPGARMTMGVDPAKPGSDRQTAWMWRYDEF